MSFAYSYDLRTRVIEEVERGKKVVMVAKTFKINRDTIYEWIKLKKITGDVVQRPKLRTSKKAPDLEKLKNFVEKFYDRTLKELVQLWGNISKTTLFRYIKKLGFTYKKNILSSKKGCWIKE